MAPDLGMGALDALLASARRECSFLRRSPWDLALVSWVPWLLVIVVLSVLGAGLLRDVPIAVVDDDRSSASRALIRKLEAAPGIHVKAMPESLDRAWPLVRQLDVFAVAYIPRDASRRIGRGDSATLFAFYNASYLTAGQAASREIGAAVQAQNAESSFARGAYLRGRSGLRAVPVRVQSTILFNAERNYEHFLGGLLLPAILLLAMCLAVVAAFGRELRDGTAGAWLDGCRQRFVAAALGKLAPYLLLFTAYGALAIVWIACLRGNGVAGSFAVLVAGYAGVFLAYSAIGLLLLGLTRNMGTALSLSGMYAGVSLAFSGGTFPVIEGPLFTQVWSKLLPYTAYVELQMQQLDMGSPLRVSARPLLTMLLFIVVAGVPALRLFGRAARDPACWGRR